MCVKKSRTEMKNNKASLLDLAPLSGSDLETYEYALQCYAPGESFAVSSLALGDMTIVNGIASLVRKGHMIDLTQPGGREQIVKMKQCVMTEENESAPTT